MAEKKTAMVKADGFTPTLPLSFENFLKHVNNKMNRAEGEILMAFCNKAGLDPFPPNPDVHIVKFVEGGEFSMVVSFYVYLRRADMINTKRPFKWNCTIVGDPDQPKTLVASFWIAPKDWEGEKWTFQLRYSQAVNLKKDGTPNRFWKKDAEYMLYKCCVSRGFRVFFPNDFEDLPYTADEVSTEPEFEFKDEAKAIKAEPIPIDVEHEPVVEPEPEKTEKVEPEPKPKAKSKAKPKPEPKPTADPNEAPWPVDGGGENLEPIEPESIESDDDEGDDEVAEPDERGQYPLLGLAPEDDTEEEEKAPAKKEPTVFELIQKGIDHLVKHHGRSRPEVINKILGHMSKQRDEPVKNMSLLTPDEQRTVLLMVGKTINKLEE